MQRTEYNFTTGITQVIQLTQAEIDDALLAKTIEDAQRAMAAAETLGQENYKALIRRQADDLGNAGQYWEAIKLLKTIGE